MHEIAFMLALAAIAGIALLINRLLDHQPDEPTAPAHHIRFLDPNGLEATMAMHPGDAAGFGGVRVDITDDRRITVTPHDDSRSETSRTE